jgi:hypothetical protein
MQDRIQQSTEHFPDAIPFIMEGQVVATDDPEQMGRVKVWIPALDGEKYNVDLLPWTNYASPLFGFTTKYPAGNGMAENESQSAYGFWAIPKIGAVVLVFCLNANPDQRYYFASKILYHKNRSLPLGKNKDASGEKGPFGEDAKESKKIQPSYDNLREQFSNDLDAPQAKTRGAYERQVSSDNKDDGYSTSPIDETYIDPQTVCFVTPGRHAIIFQDDPKIARLRIKTAEGHQFILDDANERIYVSTSKGNTWLELDQDGHMHVFAAESISFNSNSDINFRAAKDLNLYAEKNINIRANTGTLKIESGDDFHIKSIGSIFQEACKNLSLLSENEFMLSSNSSVDIFSQGSLAMTSKSSLDLKSTGALKMSAKPLHFNGPGAKSAKKAECAQRPSNPSIIPDHEPWKRPESKNKRGPNWKE